MAQPLGGDVGVDLRGGQRGVAEQLLHGAQVGTALEQVGGRGVPQPVRAHVGCSGHVGEPRVHQRADRALVDAPARARRGTPPRRRPGDHEPRPARRQPAAEGPVGRDAVRARCAPCAPCRTPAPRGASGRRRPRRDRTARRPGCRWRRAARGSPRRAARPGCRRRPRRGAASSSARAWPASSAGGRVLCAFGEPRAAPGSVAMRSGAQRPGGEHPHRRGPPRHRRARLAERLLVGQPAAQGAQVEGGQVGVAERRRVREQPGDVAEVGAHRVRREVTLGGQVALVRRAAPRDIGSGSVRPRPGLRRLARVSAPACEVDPTGADATARAGARRPCVGAAASVATRQRPSACSTSPRGAARSAPPGSGSGRARRCARSRPGRRRHHRHRVEHLPLAATEPVARLDGRPRVGHGWLPDGATASSTSSPVVTSRASRARTSWCTPADGALVTGPGTPITVAAEAAGPAGGVERPAAHRGLHHDRAAGERGDQPVAGQEPDPRRRAPGRGLGDHQTRRRRCSRSAPGARPGRPGRPRTRGRPPSAAAASAPRWAAWSMPKAAPETTVHAPARSPAISPATCRAVRRGRPRPDHGDRLLGRLVEAQRAAAPQPERYAAALVQVRRPRQVLERRPATPRPRVRRTACPASPPAASSRAGSTRRQPLGEVGAELAVLAVSRSEAGQRRSRRSSCTRSASRGSPGSPTSGAPPGPAARPRRQRITRSRSRPPGGGEQQGLGRPQPQGHVELGARRAGRRRAGRPPTTRPGAPARRRAASAARRSTSLSSSVAAASVSGHALAQRRPRARAR